MWTVDYVLAENCEYGNLRDTGTARSYRCDHSRHRSLRASTTRLRLKPRKSNVRQRGVVHQQNQTLTEADGASATPTSSITAPQPTEHPKQLTGRARNRSKSRYSGPTSNPPRHCTRCEKEPLIPTPLPEYPWQRVGSDLFHLNATTYLTVFHDSQR